MRYPAADADRIHEYPHRTLVLGGGIPLALDAGGDLHGVEFGPTSYGFEELESLAFGKGRPIASEPGTIQAPDDRHRPMNHHIASKGLFHQVERNEYVIF